MATTRYTLNGNAGDDVLHGGNGNDTINGDDLLWSHYTNSTLCGDGGTDTFAFRHWSGSDTVDNYSLGATEAASENIYLCGAEKHTGENHSNNTDYVISAIKAVTTLGNETLTGITIASTNLANLNVIYSCDP